MELGATQRSVTMLDLLESFLPSVFEFAVTKTSDTRDEVECWTIWLRVKRNHMYAEFMRECSNEYHFCNWPFKKGGAEECIRKVLCNFGGRRRITTLRDRLSWRNEYSTTNIPNFETIEEFEMKMMLSGKLV